MKKFTQLYYCRYRSDEKCYSYKDWWPAKRDTWVDYETSCFIELLIQFESTDLANDLNII